MVSIQYMPVPESMRNKPVWEQYVPTIDEFLNSGKDSALVTDDEVKKSTLVGRLRNAINHVAEGKVTIAMRGGDVYLMRCNQ